MREKPEAGSMSVGPGDGLTPRLSVPRELRRGALSPDQSKSLASAVGLIELMQRRLSIASLADIELLDMGCGTKLVQALLEYDLPIKRYVGIDVYREMIDFLNAHVSDARFSFHHMNLNNEMYNPGGERLSDCTELPVAPASFDAICLFSVFTHLAPHDFGAMLSLLRRCIRPDGQLIFSLFVNERTAGGYGLIDQAARQLGIEDEPESDAVPDFVDARPGRPLEWALYSRSHALELCEDTGWKVESLNDPEPHIQHYMICRPD